MAQHDYVISNGTGAAVRSDLNNALLAIVSQNSGATEPTTTYAYQWWADTTTGLLKIRNSANNAWITLRELDGTLTVEDGTVSAPGLAFRDDLNTGIWRPGTDQFAISTNGVERVEWGTSEVVFNDGGTNYDFRVEGDTNANLLFVDASADAVGIGTSTPGSFAANALVVEKANTSGITISESTGAGSAVLAFAATSSFDNKARIFSEVGYSTLKFATAGSTAVTIDSSQRVGIGTQSPAGDLQISGSGDRSVLVTGGTSGTVSVQLGDSTAAGQGGIYYDNSVDGLFLKSNGTERARIDSSGRLLVGTSTSSGFASSRMIITGAGTDATASGNLVLQIGQANGSVTSGEQIGTISFGDTSGYSYATIEAAADLTAGSDSPGRLVFSVTSDGASSPTEALRISNDRSIAVTQAPGKYSISTSEGATSIANNGTVDFTSFSGFILANNHTSGAVQCWLAGAGGVTSISSTGGAVGSLAYNAGIGAYRWTNNSGSTATFGFFCVRTRSAA